MAEPIYANLNGRKQSSPVKLEDLHAYIVKNKENNCDGFRKEFEVGLDPHFFFFTLEDGR